jgi:hypothetical protein
MKWVSPPSHNKLNGLIGAKSLNGFLRELAPLFTKLILSNREVCKVSFAFGLFFHPQNPLSPLNIVIFRVIVLY